MLDIISSVSSVTKCKMAGFLQVISGCVHSGKTRELIIAANRSIHSGQDVRIYVWGTEATIIHKGVLESKDGLKTVTGCTKMVSRLPSNISKPSVIAVDNAHKFGPPIINAVNRWLNSDIAVYISGQDMDYHGNPCPHMASLMAISDEVKKLQAICFKCGKAANFSIIAEAYGRVPVPICRACRQE